MEIYIQLPEELQKNIKYFALKCPHKEELKKYDKAIYTQSFISIKSSMYYPFLFEKLSIERLNKIHFIIEDAVSYYNSYDKTIKYNDLYYIIDHYYERYSKMFLYRHVKPYTKIRQQKILSDTKYLLKKMELKIKNII